jgi:O-antigen ligase/Flp pilus assembly protein TadD
VEKRGPPVDGLAGSVREQGEAAFVWLFCGLFLLVPVVPWPFLHFRSRFSLTYELFPPAEALVFWTLTLAGALFCLRALQRWFRQLLSQPLDLMVFLTALYAALTSIWSVDPDQTRQVTLTLTVGLIFYALGKYAVLKRGVIGPVIGSLHVAVAINNLYAILQLAGVSHALFGTGEEPIGLLGNRNHLAYFLALTLPAGLFRGWTGSRTLFRLGRINFYVSFLVMLSTFCRAGIIAGLVTLACFHMFKREQDRAVQRVRKPFPPLVRWVIVTCVAASVALVVGAGLLKPAKSQTIASRLFMWKLVAHGSLEKPLLGHGLGSFANAFQSVQAAHFRGLLSDPARLRAGEWRIARYFRQAHNEYLQILFELGGAGLVLFLVTLGIALSEFLASYLTHGNLERIRWYPLFGSIFIGGLVEALAGFPFQVTPCAMLIVFSLAVISALSREERAGHLTRAGRDGGDGGTGARAVAADRSGGAAAGAAAAGSAWLPAFFHLPSVALVLFLGHDGIGRWLGEVRYHDAMMLMEAGDAGLAPAERALVSSLAENERDGRAWNKLGMVYFQMAARDDERLAGAGRCFERALALHADSAIRVNLGCVDAAGGNIQGALRQFVMAVEMAPHSSENHFRVGVARATLQDWIGAVEALRRAVSIDVCDFKVTWTLARVWTDMGRRDEAFDQLQQNIAFLRALIAGGPKCGDPSDPEKRRYLINNLYRLAAVLERSGKPAEASSCYDEARRHEVDLRRIEARSGRPPEALPAP